MEKKEKKPRENEIDILPLLRALLSKLWLIVLVGLIVGGTVYGMTKILVKPLYRSGFTAYINNKQNQQGKDSLTYSDLSAAQQLTRTYSYMLRSDSILNASAEAMGIDPYSVDLRSKVSTEIQTDTEIIAVYVVDKDPQFAFDLATSISKVAPEYMASFVEGSSMKVIDHPLYSDRRYKPSYLQFAFFGFLAGALIVAAIVIIRCFMDDTVNSESDIEERFSFPVLGVIPDMVTAEKDQSDYYYYAQDKQSHENERSHLNNEAEA